MGGTIIIIIYIHGEVCSQDSMSTVLLELNRKLIVSDSVVLSQTALAADLLPVLES